MVIEIMLPSDVRIFEPGDRVTWVGREDPCDGVVTEISIDDYTSSPRIWVKWDDGLMDYYRYQNTNLQRATEMPTLPDLLRGWPA